MPTRPYRAPHTKLNRTKLTTKVRPVKKSKIKVTMPKPSVLELKRIYAPLKKLPTNEQLTVLARAVQWYREAFKYVHHVKTVKNLEYSSLVAKNILAFKAMFDRHIDDTFTQHTVMDGLEKGLYVVRAFGIKAPSLKPYYRPMKDAAKKHDALIDKISARYDKQLTLLSQAIASPYIFKVSAKSQEYRRADQKLKVIYLSRARVKDIALSIRKRGLLAVVIEEVGFVARAMSYKRTDKGVFIPPTLEEVQMVQKDLMEKFCQWATTSKEAPKRILIKPRKLKP